MDRYGRRVDESPAHEGKYSAGENNTNIIIKKRIVVPLFYSQSLPRIKRPRIRLHYGWRCKYKAEKYQVIEMRNAEMNKTSDGFSLNGFLVGLVISGLFFVTLGIALFSLSSMQDSAMEIFSVERGTTILIGGLFGFIVSIFSALAFERKSR